ncbi:uncharacterized protein L201_006880 [Kwoniella dendrophila CBS 6074]|uniref:DUF803-domain-containing protein n=1 Tax=Kwoniella dendrophila CBS 6074 TaxID=1295534 RepID=A0AAX4K431_9TREE
MSSSSASSAAVSASASTHGLVDQNSNPTFKIVGICLAVGSGLLIGSSFVIKKKGLIESTKKYGNIAGEGHGYLKSWLWWTGMITMILGEICNFVAYAFTEAILVTPMGALSVVVAAILSHFLLKEKLTFFGWIGCTLCIMGAVILALNAPEEQSVTTINEFKKLFLSVGFLVWSGLLIAGSLVMIFFVAPKWGKKSMLPYISICSLIGGISVSCTQGLGASIVTSIQGNNQVKNWFFWFLFVFVVITLLTEINYLNKALELFNTSMVVPVYFCFFSSATLITSFILYQGLKASAVTLITMVLGFLVTCLGITLLQLSKVDPEALDSKLDRKSTILMKAASHQTEDAEKGQVTSMEDPGMDALRGGFGAVGSIIRARSVSRRMSNASSSGMGMGMGRSTSMFSSKNGGVGGGLYGHNSSGNLSTHGLGQLERFQLSDNPMPVDAMDQISLHSAKSPSALSPHGFPNSGHGYFPSPQRSKSQLKFEEADVVHQYHYGTQPDDAAVHTYRPHQHPPPSPSADTNRGFPMMGGRRPSGGPVYPVMEEDEDPYGEKEKGSSSSTRVQTNPVIVRDQAYTEEPRHLHSNYSDPYSELLALPPPHQDNSGGGGKLNSGHRGFSGLFHFPSGPDLSLSGNNQNHENKRSKSKDRSEENQKEKKFPQTKLSKQNKNDSIDKQERTALVDHQAYDDDGDSFINQSDDDDDATYEDDGKTTEGGHDQHQVEFGVGHRINLSREQSPIPTTPTPMTATTATTFGTNSSDRTSDYDSSSLTVRPTAYTSAANNGNGNGNGTGNGIKGLMGPRAPKSKNDSPGFAGPRYGS